MLGCLQCPVSSCWPLQISANRTWCTFWTSRFTCKHHGLKTRSTKQLAVSLTLLQNKKLIWLRRLRTQICLHFITLASSRPDSVDLLLRLQTSGLLSWVINSFQNNSNSLKSKITQTNTKQCLQKIHWLIDTRITWTNNIPNQEISACALLLKSSMTSKSQSRYFQFSLLSSKSSQAEVVLLFWKNNYKCLKTSKVNQLTLQKTFNPSKRSNCKCRRMTAWCHASMRVRKQHRWSNPHKSRLETLK